MSMKVPEVVQTTSMMIAHIATLGPESHSHQLRPKGPPAASPAGASCTPTRPSSRCTSPRGSENHCGPSRPNMDSSWLIAPELENMNRNTTLIATELVTDGK